jgi:hypothetical protein
MKDKDLITASRRCGHTSADDELSLSSIYARVHFVAVARLDFGAC